MSIFRTPAQSLGGYWTDLPNNLKINKINRLINDKQNETIDKVEHAADVMEISDKIEEYSWYENDHDTMKDDF